MSENRLSMPLRGTVHLEKNKCRRSVASPTILVVGEVGNWKVSDKLTPPNAQTTCIRFADLGCEMLSATKPDVILSDLLSQSYDCLDIATVLQNNAFMGRYRAMSAGLPNPELVRTEVIGQCPGVDFDILDMPVNPSIWIN